jgi:Reverse transcriptase (RNA-dependent DNA polymerase)
MNFNTVDAAFEYFSDTFNWYFEIHFPKRKKNNKTKKKSWVTNDIVESSNKLKDLYRMKSEFPDLQEIYKCQKKNHELLVNASKKLFYQTKIDNSDNPSRTAWGVLSELSNKSKTKKDIIIREGDITVEDPQIVANIFGEHFKNAPYETVSQILPVDLETQDHYMQKINSVRNSLFLLPYTAQELGFLLKEKLKHKYSAGYDDIPAALILQVLEYLIEPLTHLVNLSFANGCIPDCLKVGKVIPIYKKDDAKLIDNYRPVTIPSSFLKIFECAFLNRLLPFLYKNEVFSGSQHGFISNRSTITAVHSFYSQLVKYVDAGECPVGIFCDLSRAFDCVNHTILLEKLSKCGIRGVAFDWMASYLSNWKKYVSLNGNTKSNHFSAEIGVPQGSTLGPILFILYMNDIDMLSQMAHLTLYADDTSVIVTDQDDEKLISLCKDVFSSIKEWFSVNSLLLNSSKTKVIRFHNRQKEVDILSFNDMKTTDLSANFLGVKIDSCFNWNDHCLHIVAKLSSVAYQLRSLRDVLSIDQLLKLYYAQVDSRLRYGISLWGLSGKAMDVFLIQKRIIRIMAGISSRISCHQYFKKFGILTLASLFIFEMSCYVFNNKDSFLKRSDCHNYNTRKNNDLNVPFCRVKASFIAPDALGIRIFNNIPDEIKKLENKHTFRKHLKLFLLDKSYYRVDEYLNIKI